MELYACGNGKSLRMSLDGKFGLMHQCPGKRLWHRRAVNIPDWYQKLSADTILQIWKNDMILQVVKTYFLQKSVLFTYLTLKKGGEALLGKDPDPELVKYYSNELQVKADTPPTILFLADDDKAVPSENSILMYRALQAKGVPAEIHIVSEGGHGYGLSTMNEHIGSWKGNLKLWLEWINKQPTGK